jgi:ribosomal protein S18 acetylase RimI-like enzyme
MPVPPRNIAPRRLTPQDASAYRAFMLDGYAAHPDLFTSSVQERSKLPLSWWEQRLVSEPDAEERVFGVFDDFGTFDETGQSAPLVAAAGLSVERGDKTRHKGRLFGMLVAPTYRQCGLGGALVRAILREAQADSALRILQLRVTDTNDVAQRLYARHGFVEYGLEPLAVRVVDGFINKRLMWIDLASTQTPLHQAP